MRFSSVDILLLDGNCGLCNRLAIFMNSNLNTNKKIKFLPIDSDQAQDLIKTFKETTRYRYSIPL